MGILDHVSIGIKDISKARAFYDAVLNPLGLVRRIDFEEIVSGYGPAAGRPYFWMGVPEAGWGDHDPAKTGVHVAFAADSRKAVDAFYAAGLKNGGRDNGAPGERPYYHPDYYGAFIFDPDGNKIEAVCREPAKGG